MIHNYFCPLLINNVIYKSVDKRKHDRQSRQNNHKWNNKYINICHGHEIAIICT